MGGAFRPFLANAVAVSWSPDRRQLVYHSPSPGDPIFVADRNGENPRKIFESKPGIHNHHPVWSPDGAFIYFVHGIPAPYDMDIWRVPAAGGAAERLTHHRSRVAYPTFLGERTLIYCATREDGSGSGLFAMDVERRIPRAVTTGVEEYLSIAASVDGRRLVTAVGNPVQNFWTVPILDRPVDDSAATRFRIPTVRSANPRFGPDYLVYLSSRGGADGVWKLKDGVETELWKGSDGAVTAAPAVSRDGSQICFAARIGGRSYLYLMAGDGTGAHRLSESLDVGDAPSFSPDGKWIVVVAHEGQEEAPLFKLPVDGGAPVRLVGGVNYNPVWSPDGRFIVYSEAPGAASHILRAITAEKQPVSLPDIRVRFEGNRYRFLPDGRLVLMQGDLHRQNFWLLDVGAGSMRQLTNLDAGKISSFDVSPDGKTILFDRYRENSDIVLIDLPPR
jgi:Tol biopolymer transport system component